MSRELVPWIIQTGVYLLSGAGESSPAERPGSSPAIPAGRTSKPFPDEISPKRCRVTLSAAYGR